jgi:ketosteroid isomerase-like protein
MSTNADTTATVIDSFFTRFGTGDIPGMLDLFADPIDFAVNGAPHVPWSGARSSRAIEGDNAVVLGRNKFEVLATKKKFTNDFALHFIVQGGKITGYHMYEDSYAISTAFTPHRRSTELGTAPEAVDPAQ